MDLAVKLNYADLCSVFSNKLFIFCPSVLSFILFRWQLYYPAPASTPANCHRLAGKRKHTPSFRRTNLNCTSWIWSLVDLYFQNLIINFLINAISKTPTWSQRSLGLELAALHQTLLAGLTGPLISNHLGRIWGRYSGYNVTMTAQKWLVSIS